MVNFRNYSYHTDFQVPLDNLLTHVEFNHSSTNYVSIQYEPARTHIPLDGKIEESWRIFYYYSPTVLACDMLRATVSYFLTSIFSALGNCT